MTQLGNTVQGGTSDTTSGQNARTILLPAMSEDGTLNSISCWLNTLNSTDRRVKYLIYDSSDNLIAESDVYSGADVSVITLVTLNVAGSVALTSGAQYRIAFFCEYTGTAYTYDILASSSEFANETYPTTPDPWVGTTTSRNLAIYLDYTASTGPTLTGPDTTTVDATRTVTGTALDTATTAGLKTVGYSKTLTITPIDTVSFSQVDEIDAGIALGTPVASLPVEADVLAAGATAWQIQQWVDDGVNPEVARNITLNYLAAHTTVQAMIATANTTPGESLQATNIIAVEDDMQHSGPNVVDTVTITRAADGTLTTDKDQTISFTERYWSPSTGQASYAGITVKGSAIISVGGASNTLRLNYVNKTQFYIN